MWTPGIRALVGDYGSGQALSDEQYRLLEPLIPTAKPRGHPRTTDMRHLLDALFYLVRTGCQWRHLPPPLAFPPWLTIAVGMQGLLLGVLVHAAFIQDADSAGDLLRRIKPLYNRLRAVFADSIYDCLAVLLAYFLLGLTLIIVRRITGAKGFVVLPRR